MLCMLGQIHKRRKRAAPAEITDERPPKSTLPDSRLLKKTNLETVYFGAVLTHLSPAMEPPTLAAKLGTTTHISPLLMKAKRLGLGSQELAILAVQRGCAHYSNGDEPEEPLATERDFSNEELAIALLLPALAYNPHSIRCGAAMLGAADNDPRKLASLTVMERALTPVRYVAEAGERFEPENRFWQQLLALLPPAPKPKSGVLPHPTRFIAMTGFTRAGPGLVIEWQRPTPRQVEPAHD